MFAEVGRRWNEGTALTVLPLGPSVRLDPRDAGMLDVARFDTAAPARLADYIRDP